MTLGFGMQHWGLGPNKVCSNDGIELTLIFFTARSDLLPYAFIWENIHFFRKNVRMSFNGRNFQQMGYIHVWNCEKVQNLSPCPGSSVRWAFQDHWFSGLLIFMEWFGFVTLESLVSHKWVLGKQSRSRSDAAKCTPDTPKIGNGLIQLIWIGWFTRNILWVKDWNFLTLFS